MNKEQNEGCQICFLECGKLHICHHPCENFYCIKNELRLELMDSLSSKHNVRLKSVSLDPIIENIHISPHIRQPTTETIVRSSFLRSITNEPEFFLHTRVKGIYLENLQLEYADFFLPKSVEILSIITCDLSMQLPLLQHSQALKQLNLSGNRLGSFPNQVLSLSSLNILNLSENREKMKFLMNLDTYQLFQQFVEHTELFVDEKSISFNECPKNSHEIFHSISKKQNQQVKICLIEDFERVKDERLPENPSKEESSTSSTSTSSSLLIILFSILGGIALLGGILLFIMFKKPHINSKELESEDSLDDCLINDSCLPMINEDTIKEPEDKNQQRIEATRPSSRINPFKTLPKRTNIELESNSMENLIPFQIMWSSLTPINEDNEDDSNRIRTSVKTTGPSSILFSKIKTKYKWKTPKIEIYEWKNKYRVRLVPLRIHLKEKNETDLTDFTMKLDCIKNLIHPYLLLFHGLCWDNQWMNYYYVVEDIEESENLHDVYLIQRKQIPSWEFMQNLLRIGQEIAMMLSYLHEQTPFLIYPLLSKRQEILITSMTQTCKLNPFYCCCLSWKMCSLEERIGPFPNQYGYSQQLVYYPPEIYQQNKMEWNMKSDVYGWGILMYELLEGVHPFHDFIFENGLTWTELYLKFLINTHQVKEWNFLRQHFKSSMDISNEFQEMIFACLNFDPSQRPSISTVLSVLEKERKFHEEKNI